MNTRSKETPSDLFVAWQTEDREMDLCVEDLRSWMNEVNQLGIPHFGEAATRLTMLRNRLIQHFDREDQIIEGLAEHFTDSDPALTKLQAHASRDHQQILQRLDALMERLNQLEPPFESWVAAMSEIESFVSGLHQHEREESNSFAAIMTAGDSQI